MKIAAACAGVGIAVGAVLLLALRFVVGDSVLAGLGSAGTGMRRRYVDYLPTGSGTFVDDVRVLTGVLGAGLVIGLLFGVLVRIATARRAAGARHAPIAASLGLSGLVVGALLAVLLHLYGGRIAGGGGDFGWYAYSPLSSDGVFYGGGSQPSWWPLVLTGALVGLIPGAMIAGVIWTRRRFRGSTSPSG